MHLFLSKKDQPVLVTAALLVGFALTPFCSSQAQVVASTSFLRFLYHEQHNFFHFPDEKIKLTTAKVFFLIHISFSI